MDVLIIFDPEVNHGIDELILQLGCAIVSEDSLAPYIDKKAFNVLNHGHITTECI